MIAMFSSDGGGGGRSGGGSDLGLVNTPCPPLGAATACQLLFGLSGLGLHTQNES